MFVGGYDYTENSQYEATKSLFNEYDLKEADIVFVGDSITSRCDYSEFFTNFVVANRGIGSDTTEGLLNRLDSIVCLKPDYCVILIGINDLGHGITIDAISSNMVKILRELHNNQPEMHLILLSVLPCSDNKINNDDVKKLNEEYSRIANEIPSVEYVDLYSSFESNISNLLSTDGVHLNGKGYRLLVDEVKTRIVKE